MNRIGVFRRLLPPSWQSSRLLTAAAVAAGLSGGCGAGRVRLGTQPSDPALADPGHDAPDEARAPTTGDGWPTTGDGWPTTGDGSPIAGGDRAPEGGDVDCTTLAGTITSIVKGTYCVRGDVIVPYPTTLVIPAGTTFVFMGRYRFGRDPTLADTVGAQSGSIHAIGTAAEPIVFRGATPDTAWMGIVVSYAADTVRLEYVTIRDTYKDDRDPSSRIWRRGGALGSYVNARGTIIRHSTFINNRAWSVAGAIDINGHGVWPNAGPVEITDSRFEDNLCECGIYSGSATDLCGGGAIRLSHVGGSSDLVKIRNNVFRHNASRQTNAAIGAYGGAIGGFDSGVVIGPGNLFENNRADSGDGALSCSHQSTLGTIIDAVDPSTVFRNNVPDNGCGL